MSAALDGAFRKPAIPNALLNKTPKVINIEESMESNEALQKVLKAFSHYYDIQTENVEAPFTALAEFHSHSEQYFLVKAAKIADIDSNEFVFFSAQKNLSDETLSALDAAAWEQGLSKVSVRPGHHNSDVTLVILSDTIDERASRRIKKLKHSKSYCFTLKGWSNYRIIALETSSGKISCNRLGKDLKKVLGSI